MSFNSTLFIFFLPTVVLLYYALQPRQRAIMLLIASWLFYLTYIPWFIWIILLTTVIDYFAGLLIHRENDPTRRKLFLCLSLVTNLGLLAFFKYTNFFLANVLPLFRGLGFATPDVAFKILLPLGISFHTFQGMSYTIDVYRKEIGPVRSFVDFALFVAFFPQLVAGPIVRSPEFIPQITCHSEADWATIRRGVAQILYGLVKKVYVADVMASIVNEAYGDPKSFSGMGLLLATYAFAVQIYCDFSGYSDVAIGSALLFGIRLPQNFNAPYLSCSIREFWRRWHMTLSRWLRDYLYVSIGGSRKGELRTYVNLMITMLLGGLWHGAGWNWVVWGGINGSVMCIERFFGIEESRPKSLAVRLFRWFLTFHIVCLCWVFFRVKSMGEARVVLGRIFSWAPGAIPDTFSPVFYLALVVAMGAWNFRERWMSFFEASPVAIRWVTYASILAFILTFARASHPEFIYFAF